MEEVVRNSIQEDNSTDLDIEYNSLFETANALIQKMPARQKEIYLLSMNEQMTTDQIAKQLNISKKTVENYLSRVKTSVKKTFSGGNVLSFLFLCLFFI